MIKPIGIIAGEPNSISSEIIFKSWSQRKIYKNRPLFIIGSIKILNLQKKKLKYKIKIKSIDKNFSIADLKTNYLPVIDVNYNQQKPFEKITARSNNYIFKCFDVAIKLLKDKKIKGIINCPIKKETLFKNKHQGITEYLSKKLRKQGNEVMLIYNKKLSVCPVTTHIPLQKVSKVISKRNIIRCVKTINNFYKTIFNIKPKFAVLGLNPHSYSPLKLSEEKKIISKSVNSIKKKKIKVIGPISPDTSFMNYKIYKFNVIIGMYHDQVLTSFKALFKYNAINITLGLPFVRISPDHGVGENIVGKNLANNRSLIEAIIFFNNIKSK
jgi:4-hydroxythreonine-4-phosphate dehydrogenase